MLLLWLPKNKCIIILVFIVLVTHGRGDTLNNILYNSIIGLFSSRSPSTWFICFFNLLLYHMQHNCMLLFHVSKSWTCSETVTTRSTFEWLFFLCFLKLNSILKCLSHAKQQLCGLCGNVFIDRIKFVKHFIRIHFSTCMDCSSQVRCLFRV